ncbi:hypothetical protein BDF22DRAFT_698177 [Syncephalis plumigaleata]|nr:hypothetical protein BDF22DRAFT_698177 [Syncephalis plumigaleata]
MEANERLQWDIFWRTVTPFPDNEFSVVLSVEQIDSQIKRAQVHQQAAQTELLDMQRKRLAKLHEEFATSYEDRWPHDVMRPINGSGERGSTNPIYRVSVNGDEEESDYIALSTDGKCFSVNINNDVYLRSRRQLRESQKTTFLMMRSIQQEEMFSLWRQRANAMKTWSHTLWHGVLTKGPGTFYIRALTRDNAPLPELPEQLNMIQRCQLSEAALLLSHPEVRIFLLQAESSSSSSPNDEVTNTESTTSTHTIPESNLAHFSERVVQFLHNNHYAAIVSLAGNSKLHLLPITKLYVPGNIPANLREATSSADVRPFNADSDEAAPQLGNLDHFMLNIQAVWPKPMLSTPAMVSRLTSDTTGASTSSSQEASAKDLVHRIFQNALSDTRWLHTKPLHQNKFPS